MSDHKTLTFDESNFSTEVLQSKQPVLVDFWATWCPPCKVFGPIVDEVADAYHGKAKVGKVDVDHNQALAAKYNIRSIPTSLLFVDGQVVETFNGVTSSDALAHAIDAVLEQVTV